MEKEFTRYKAQSKEEIDRNEKTMEEMEGKISEVSSKYQRQLLVKKMSEAIDGSFFNLTFSSQGSEECRVLEEKARQCTGTAPQNQNISFNCFSPPRPIWRARSRRSTSLRLRLNTSRMTSPVSKKPMLMRLLHDIIFENHHNISHQCL